MTDAVGAEPSRSVRSLMVWSAAIAIGLAMYSASIVVRKEPDGFLPVLSAGVALVGLAGLVVPVLVFRRARLTMAAVGLTLAVLLAVASVCVAERWNDEIHWWRSVDHFTDMTSQGALLCDADACAAGNWTATEVLELPGLDAVFVDDEWCYAGFGFLKPSDVDMPTGEAEAVLATLGRGNVDVDPWRDGWMRFCITT